MKKRKKQMQSIPKRESSQMTLSDAIGEDVLEKLKAAKKQLTAAEQKKEEKHQEQLRQERKRKEKNKSFEELLEEYGDHGTKY